MSTFVTSTDTTPLKRMLQLLSNTDQPMLSYIWRAWLIAVIPSGVLSTMVTFGVVWFGASD